eukprot:Nk52_evm28s222 gene=Nk52_evmTU28s222
MIVTEGAKGSRVGGAVPCVREDAPGATGENDSCLPSESAGHSSIFHENVEGINSGEKGLPSFKSLNKATFFEDSNSSMVYDTPAIEVEHRGIVNTLKPPQGAVTPIPHISALSSSPFKSNDSSSCWEFATPPPVKKGSALFKDSDSKYENHEIVETPDLSIGSLEATPRLNECDDTPSESAGHCNFSESPEFSPSIRLDSAILEGSSKSPRTLLRRQGKTAEKIDKSEDSMLMKPPSQPKEQTQCIRRPPPVSRMTLINSSSQNHLALPKVEGTLAKGSNINPFTPRISKPTASSKRKMENSENDSLNTTQTKRSKVSPESGTNASKGKEEFTLFSNKSIQLSSKTKVAQSGNDGKANPPKVFANNISRYHEEFEELNRIGAGEFGAVFRCRNRLDGCLYAVKKSLKPITGHEQNVLREVYAHAVLGVNTHVVRYYSAWEENNHMLIQNEYCNGGSLAGVKEGMLKDLGLKSDCRASSNLNPNANRKGSFDSTASCDSLNEEDDDLERFVHKKYPLKESQLCEVLRQVAKGLRFIHSHGLVHLDIKPGNIFISVQYSSSEDTDELSAVDSEVSNASFKSSVDVVYKIGDLGHVTKISSPDVEEEGDCRYMSCEILKEDYSNIAKADIFALGMSIYEMCIPGPLPKNGEEWHNLRAGKIPDLPLYSSEFKRVLSQMLHPDPKVRPSADRLLKDPLLHSKLSPKEKSQIADMNELKQKLNAERFKSSVLLQQLQKIQEGTSKPMDRTGRTFLVPAKKSLETVSETPEENTAHQGEGKPKDEAGPANPKQAEQTSEKPQFLSKLARSYSVSW